MWVKLTATSNLIQMISWCEKKQATWKIMYVRQSWDLNKKRCFPIRHILFEDQSIELGIHRQEGDQNGYKVSLLFLWVKRKKSILTWTTFLPAVDGEAHKKSCLQVQTRTVRTSQRPTNRQPPQSCRLLDSCKNSFLIMDDVYWIRD